MRVGILWSLTLAQLRHHRGRWALLVLGIALVVAVPITTAGLAADVRDRSIVRTLHDLGPTDRALFVSIEGVTPGVASQRTNALVREQLARLGDKPVRRQMAFRQLTTEGRTFFLAAADDLGSGVRLTGGRLPRECTPTHCEVVLIGTPHPALDKAAATLGVDVVGTAIRTDPRLISGQLDTGGQPLLVGDGAAAMSRLESLALFSRFFSWTADVDAQRVVALGVPAYLARGSDVDERLDRLVGNSLFTRPDDALQAADTRAQISTRRFQLLGGLAAALLLGFAVVAACGLRRETGLLAGALRRRGAMPGQIAAVVAGQTVLAVLAGAVLGGALGAAAVALVADGGATIGAALTASRVAVAVLAAAAAIVICAVLLWPDTRSRALWRLLDLVALCSLGAAVLAADRGTSDLSQGSDPLVVTLPVLAAVISGLVAARLWAPAARLVARVLPSGSVAGRIGLLGMIRRPLRPAATVAFLTAAVASVVFAGAYRATLLAGAADQAAFQVPLDATVTSGAYGTAPGPAVAERPGAYGVVRVSAAVTRLAGVVEAVPVLGVDAAALPKVHRWSRVTGSSESAADLAAKLRVPSVRGPQLPESSTLAIAAGGLDPRTQVDLWVATPSGRQLRVPLRQDGTRLTGRLPAAGGPLHVTAIGVSETSAYSDREQHATGEGRTDQPNVRGTLTLGAVTADGAPVHADWSAWTSARGATSGQDGRLRINYDVTGAPLIAVPGGSVALPVAVDADTAKLAHGGQLQVTLDGS
ncbi:MAG TPA: hypothetical protein VH395_18130, partial [Jatrophihabitantaceae bacterium]